MTDDGQVLDYPCCEHCREDCQEKFPPHRGPCIYKACSGRTPIAEKRQKGHPKPETEATLTSPPALIPGMTVLFSRQGVVERVKDGIATCRAKDGKTFHASIHLGLVTVEDAAGLAEPTEHGAKVKAATIDNAEIRTLVRAFTSAGLGVWVDERGDDFYWTDLVNPEVVA